MSTLGEMGRAIVSVIVKPLKHTKVGLIALASVAGTLLEKVWVGLAHDIRVYKDQALDQQKANIEKTRAETGKLKADAIKTLSEAVALVRKGGAASGAPRTEVPEVLEHLERALSRLNQDGGGLFADSAELMQVAEMGPAETAPQLTASTAAEGGATAGADVPGEGPPVEENQPPVADFSYEVVDDPRQ